MLDDKKRKELYPETFSERRMSFEELENPERFDFVAQCLGETTRFMLERSIDITIEGLQEHVKRLSPETDTDELHDTSAYIERYRLLLEKIRTTPTCR